MTNSTSAIIRAMNKNKDGLRTEESHAIVISTITEKTRHTVDVYKRQLLHTDFQPLKTLM